MRPETWARSSTRLATSSGAATSRSIHRTTAIRSPRMTCRPGSRSSPDLYGHHTPVWSVDRSLSHGRHSRNVGSAAPQSGISSSRYTILGRLASGGMADIYLVLAVTGAGIDRHLVLKRVQKARASDPTYVQMFLDEARLAA